MGRECRQIGERWTAYGPVEGSWKHGNESWDFTKYSEILESLSDWPHLKYGAALWSQLVRKCVPDSKSKTDLISFIKEQSDYILALICHLSLLTSFSWRSRQTQKCTRPITCFTSIFVALQVRLPFHPSSHCSDVPPFSLPTQEWVCQDNGSADSPSDSLLFLGAFITRATKYCRAKRNGRYSSLLKPVYW
jgi:hypothetical protein